MSKTIKQIIGECGYFNIYGYPKDFLNLKLEDKINVLYYWAEDKDAESSSKEREE